MRSILITGGAGFVGRHFTEYFLKKGYYVNVVDPLVEGTGALPIDKWYFNPVDYSKFGFYKQDCRRYFRQFDGEHFDFVIHLAAIVGGRNMIENKPIAVADDLSIDSAFWNWCVETKVKKVVGFSSSAAYPIHLQTRKSHPLLDEEMIKFCNSHKIGRPDMSYGWAKLTYEYLGRLAFEKHGVCSVVYRPFSGYGNDQGEEYPFASILNKVKKSTGEVEVWGSGQQKRDWIHIDDVVEGVAKTMDIINDGTAINLSTGIRTSFSTLIKKAAKVLGKEVTIKPLLDKPEGVFDRCGSTKKQKKLGFDYKVSLEEGIKRFYESHSNDNDKPSK